MSETVLFVQMLTRSSNTRCALFKTCHCFNTALKNRSPCLLITEIQTVKCSCLASCLSPAEGHSVSTSCLREIGPVCPCVYLHHLCRASASIAHTHTRVLTSCLDTETVISRSAARISNTSWVMLKLQCWVCWCRFNMTSIKYQRTAVISSVTVCP